MKGGLIESLSCSFRTDLLGKSPLLSWHPCCLLPLQCIGWRGKFLTKLDSFSSIGSRHTSNSSTSNRVKHQVPLITGGRYFTVTWYTRPCETAVSRVMGASRFPSSLLSTHSNYSSVYCHFQLTSSVVQHPAAFFKSYCILPLTRFSLNCHHEQQSVCEINSSIMMSQ